MSAAGGASAALRQQVHVRHLFHVKRSGQGGTGRD